MYFLANIQVFLLLLCIPFVCDNRNLGLNVPAVVSDIPISDSKDRVVRPDPPDPGKDEAVTKDVTDQASHPTDALDSNSGQFEENGTIVDQDLSDRVVQPDRRYPGQHTTVAKDGTIGVERSSLPPVSHFEENGTIVNQNLPDRVVQPDQRDHGRNNSVTKNVSIGSEKISPPVEVSVPSNGHFEENATIVNQHHHDIQTSLTSVKMTCNRFRLTITNPSQITNVTVKMTWKPRSEQICNEVEEKTFHSSDPNEFSIPLKPWTTYHVAVVLDGNHANGKSEPCETPADVPYRNPNGVNGQWTAEKNFTITWKAMKQMELNGPAFFYRIFYSTNLTNEWNNSIDITDWKQNHFVINGENVGQSHRIKIEAHNIMGKANVAASKLEIRYIKIDLNNQDCNISLTVVKSVAATIAAIAIVSVVIFIVQKKLFGRTDSQNTDDPEPETVQLTGSSNDTGET